MKGDADMDIIFQRLNEMEDNIRQLGIRQLVFIALAGFTIGVLLSRIGA